MQKTGPRRSKCELELVLVVVATDRLESRQR